MEEKYEGPGDILTPEEFNQENQGSIPIEPTIPETLDEVIDSSDKKNMIENILNWLDS